MNEPAASSSRLDAAIAEFIESVERGQRADRAALLSQYADVADELAEFLADHDRMEVLARPLRAPAAEPEATIAATLAGPAASQPGTWQIGDYEVLSELGRGGMGVVYRARHRSLHRIVALKTILAGRLASADDRRRFQFEARAAAKLSHAGIVAIYEVGEAAGQPYIAMPLIEGASLAKRLEAGPVPPHEAARLLRKLVTAVAYAHSQGVIHRDLKPANILLAPISTSDEGPPLLGLDGCEPRITDFGLAKRLDDEGQLTASGQILGTPGYMPPEQASGRVHTVGQAADVYSLGAILYAMLTGQPPFQSENPVEVLLQVLEIEPPLPSRLQPAVPRELEWICLKCLEKNPADRYSSAAELGADLDRFMRHEPPLAGRATVVHRLRRWVRRQPVLAGHVIGIAVPLAIAQIVFVLHPGREMLYHTRISGPLAAWLLFSFSFQGFVGRWPGGRWPLFGWCAADALFLTAVLSQVNSPLGVFVGAYLLLIVASGLAGRTSVVVFATACSVLAYVGLLVLRPEEAHPPHYTAIGLAMCMLTGLAVGYQIWRMSILREFYGERNLE